MHSAESPHDRYLVLRRSGADGTDGGPREGYGEVTGKPSWRLGRISRELGILTCSCDSQPAVLKVGSRSTVEIVGQYACFIAATATHPWFYITDSSNNTVVDIWKKESLVAFSPARGLFPRAGRMSRVSKSKQRRRRTRMLCWYSFVRFTSTSHTSST